MSSITSTPEKGALTLTVKDGIGWLTLDLPGEKVNKLSNAVMTSLSETLGELARRSDLEGIVIRSAKDGIFIAGADVQEIRAVTRLEDAAQASRLGQEIFQRIQDLPFPAVAAINGVCVGGGTELGARLPWAVGDGLPSVRCRFPRGEPGNHSGVGWVDAAFPAWWGCSRRWR